MATYKISYFDFPGGRGEDSRLALHLAGADFVDDRIPPPQWRDLKASTPYGGLPVLEVEGKGRLAQSNAILGYLGRAFGMHPSDPWAAAQHEAIMAAVEDLRGKVGATLQITDPEERKKAREALASGAIPAFAAAVEAQLGDGPYVAGDALNVVDLKLFVLQKWFISGSVDHVPATVFDGFPRLRGIHDAVAAHPAVVAWYARFKPAT
ncbi:MAG: glutathione S-transferase family protein [Nannocystaceae bacterium]